MSVYLVELWVTIKHQLNPVMSMTIEEVQSWVVRGI